MQSIRFWKLELPGNVSWKFSIYPEEKSFKLFYIMLLDNFPIENASLIFLTANHQLISMSRPLQVKLEFTDELRSVLLKIFHLKLKRRIV